MTTLFVNTSPIDKEEESRLKAFKESLTAKKKKSMESVIAGIIANNPADDPKEDEFFYKQFRSIISNMGPPLNKKKS